MANRSSASRTPIWRRRDWKRKEKVKEKRRKRKENDSPIQSFNRGSSLLSQEANCFCHSNFDARRQPPSLKPQIARSLRYFLFRENGIIIQDFLITCLASRGKGWWRQWWWWWSLVIVVVDVIIVFSAAIIIVWIYSGPSFFTSSLYCYLGQFFFPTFFLRHCFDHLTILTHFSISISEPEPER